MCRYLWWFACIFVLGLYFCLKEALNNILLEHGIVPHAKLLRLPHNVNLGSRHLFLESFCCHPLSFDFHCCGLCHKLSTKWTRFQMNKGSLLKISVLFHMVDLLCFCTVGFCLYCRLLVLSVGFSLLGVPGTLKKGILLYYYYFKTQKLIWSRKSIFYF